MAYLRAEMLNMAQNIISFILKCDVSVCYMQRKSFLRQDALNDRRQTAYLEVQMRQQRRPA